MRSMRLAALTVAMTLAFSGLALARDQDADRYRHDQYKDKHEDRHHDRDHDRDRDRDRDHHWWNRDRDRNDRNWEHSRNNDGWRESDRERIREHERWEREHRNGGYNDGYYGGPVYNRYPRGYPGYPGGGYSNPGAVYGRGGYGNGGSLGYNQGLQDGSNQARKDVAQGKPFNPNPRGGNHSDRGYHSYMGDKNTYRASYDQGYRSGYQSNFGGRGRGWGY